MRVFDIVMHVESGTVTSRPAGRWAAGYGRSDREAHSLAERYNQCAGVDGIRYAIEEHDEECPGRARHYRDEDEGVAGECGCRGKVEKHSFGKSKS